MVKTAPAPASTGAGSGPLKAVAVIIVGVIIFIVGQSAGWWGTGDGDPETSDDEQRKHLVTWEVFWGQVFDTGEEYEDTGKPIRILECDGDRELNITTYVDGEPSTHNPYESDATEPCHFKWHQEVPHGSELRMLVEEVSRGGWKMCQIKVDDFPSLPGGFMIRNDGGDCETWGIAL